MTLQSRKTKRVISLYSQTRVFDSVVVKNLRFEDKDIGTRTRTCKLVLEDKGFS